MEVGAVYLQPVEMDPPGMMRAAAESDVHLEADISATEDNRNGWQEGSFVPYLSIHYTLRKKGSDEVVEGDFHPMVANDGPHYGDNVKLLGPGKYQLTYKIRSEEHTSELQSLMRIPYAVFCLKKKKTHNKQH